MRPSVMYAGQDLGTVALEGLAIRIHDHTLQQLVQDAVNHQHREGPPPAPHASTVDQATSPRFSQALSQMFRTAHGAVTTRARYQACLMQKIMSPPTHSIGRAGHRPFSEGPG